MSGRKIVISSHPKEQKITDEVIVQLKAIKQELWSESDIPAGTNVDDAFQEAVEQAAAAIYLVSANSLDPDFLDRKGMQAFVNWWTERKMGLFPLLARACPYENGTWVSGLAVRPTNRKFLDTMSPSKRAAVLTQFAAEVAKLVDSATAATPGERRNDRAPVGAPQQAPDRLEGLTGRETATPVRNQGASLTDETVAKKLRDLKQDIDRLEGLARVSPVVRKRLEGLRQQIEALKR